MNSLKSTARRAGILYFITMILGISTEFFLPHYIVPGNPAATTLNISNSITMYRLDIFLGLVSGIVFLFVADSLYRLLKHVDPHRAFLMVLLVCTGIIVSLSNSTLRFAPLLFINNAEQFSAFSQPQLEALNFASLKLKNAATAIPIAFWGIWLLPFGTLVIKSGFLPRILGYCLYCAGVAYMISSSVSILFPEYTTAVSQYMMPLYFGEVPVILWLLLKGINLSSEQTTTHS